MSSLNKFTEKFKVFSIGFLVGFSLTTLGGYLYVKRKGIPRLKVPSILKKMFKEMTTGQVQVTEEFDQAMEAGMGKRFGAKGQLTFELYRGGAFLIDGKSGFAWQKSDRYGDVAVIRSTYPLPQTYKVTLIVGHIDYGLEKIKGLENDPRYPEGPKNENGCYLLAITDEEPSGHHTNIWWHQHRKVVIDLDNNIWGHGMPNPILMVYFDKENRLVSFDGDEQKWRREWRKAATYESGRWYKINLEKTKTAYKMSVNTEEGKILAKGQVDLKNIWHGDEFHPDYLVLGDPHENYYQGSFKIKSISMMVAQRK